MSNAFVAVRPKREKNPRESTALPFVGGASYLFDIFGAER